MVHQKLLAESKEVPEFVNLVALFVVPLVRYQKGSSIQCEVEHWFK